MKKCLYINSKELSRRISSAFDDISLDDLDDFYDKVNKTLAKYKNATLVSVVSSTYQVHINSSNIHPYFKTCLIATIMYDE